MFGPSSLFGRLHLHTPLARAQAGCAFAQGGDAVRQGPEMQQKCGRRGATRPAAIEAGGLWAQGAAQAEIHD